MDKKFETSRVLSDTHLIQNNSDLKAIPRVVVSELEDGNFLRMTSNNLSIFKKDDTTDKNLKLEQTSFNEAFNFLG